MRREGHRDALGGDVGERECDSLADGIATRARTILWCSLVLQELGAEEQVSCRAASNDTRSSGQGGGGDTEEFAGLSLLRRAVHRCECATRCPLAEK